MKTTETTQHTPGPWHIQKHDALPIYEINNGPGYERTQIALNVNKANARLIAAAPCLLSALKDMLSSANAGDLDSLANASEAAQEAIGKAEGVQ